MSVVPGAAGQPVPEILAIDLGTSACKATVYAETGRVLRRASRALTTRRPAPGLAEQDATAWWDAAMQAGREAADSVAIDAIALTSCREAVALTDADGVPLAPVMMWMDRRGAREARDLAATFPDVHRLTGHRPDANFTACKMAWLSRHHPDLLSAARWVLQPRDFLYFHLTGTPVTDPSLASRTLWWRRDGGWWPEALEFSGVKVAQLPGVLPSHAAPGRLSSAAARTLGVRGGIPVVVGAGDRTCEVIATRALRGRVMVSLGTAVNVSTMVREPVPDNRLVFSAAAVEGMEVAEQGIPSGSALLDWLHGLLGGDRSDLQARAAQVAPGAAGLVLLPFLGGSRATRWNPNASGVLAGFSLSTRREDLLRSGMEGVACEVRAALGVLRQAGVATDALVLVGGPAQHSVWPRVIEDACNMPGVAVADTEAASMGAFLLAGRAVGAWDDPLVAAETRNPDIARSDPDPTAAAYYARHAEAYEALYAALETWFAQFGAREYPDFEDDSGNRPT
jgi:xylulokinase